MRTIVSDLVSGFVEERLLGCGKGQKQRPGLAHKGTETETQIESNRSLIFCIDQQREGRYISLHRTMGGIGEERCAEATPLEPSIDSQATDAHRRQSGVAGQAFGLFRREVHDRYAR